MKQWEKQFAASALIRGKDYFDNGEVVRLSFEDDEQEYFQAEINSSRYGQTYIVSGRYRHNGKVSELFCACPWAQKGHRCKHMVAALYKIDQMREDGVSQAEMEADLISLNDELPARISLAARYSDFAGDPLQMISQQKFYSFDYQEANSLAKNISVANHYFDIDDQRSYFHIEFKSGFLSFIVGIAFDSQTIQRIDVQSVIKNFNENALKIIALTKFVEYFVEDNPLEKTNRSAKLMLDLFNEQAENAAPIILRAQLEKDYDDFYLTFRLGEPGHLYKVQNVANIVDYARRSTPLKLGKFFNRTIAVAQMDEGSQKWFHFIEKLVDTNEVLAEARNDYGYLSFKKLTLASAIADQIDALQRRGAPLYDREHKISYQIQKTKLPIDIEVNQADQAATIRIGELPDFNREDFIQGNECFYCYAAGKWTRYEGVNPNYLNQVGIFQKDMLVFGPDSLPTFARKILPKLKASGNFEIQGQGKLEAILPPEAKIIFQLDLQNSVIVLHPVVRYGEQEYQLMQKANDKVVREFEKEKQALQLVDQLGFNLNKKDYEMPLAENKRVDQFLDDGLNQLKKLGQVKATTSFKRLLGNIKAKTNLSLGIRLNNNTLDLTVTGEKLSTEDVQAILTAYQEKQHYFMLKNGEMRQVVSPSVETLAAVMKKLDLNLKQFVKGKMAVPAYRAFYLEKQLQGRNNLEYTSNSAFDKLINDLEHGSKKAAAVPSSLQKILRPYQKQGFEWLNTLIDYNLGALLADEMGLGKTLQVISVLLARKNKTDLPSLVVAPASVIYNWESEVNKFAPEIRTLVLGGSKKQRLQQLEQIATADLLITSYDSLKRDVADYQDLKFDLEVIDEAQNIKNAKTAVAKSVKVINADHRIALTGTPIENNLSELWSIFDYLMPGFLGEYKYFRENYEKPIVKEGDEATEKDLSQIIAPFILRRLKQDVLKDLPDKNEEVVYVKMTGKQEQLYQAQTQKLLNRLQQQDEQDFKKERFAVLAAITKLRELCCDPHLLYADYHGKSAKLVATLNLIQESLAAGHKILLFSQFTSMLDIVKEKLAQLKLDTYVITGSTPKQKRQALIREFNELDHPAVFLISLKAGGTGINLTSADMVIHLDPWWNVAAENQATDRAHRIGQKHKVQIYKMVAQHTIEEKIIELQQVKSKLAETILNGKNVGSSSLKREDLLKILER